MSQLVPSANRVVAMPAPPPPPYPAFDRVLSPDELEQGLREFRRSYYAEHPFHARMHAGELSATELRGWAANRIAYQRAIPRKDAAILSACPDVDVRRRWIQRIIDHDGGADGEGGLERWMRLGEAMGLSRVELSDARHVLPSVRMAAESYVTFCRTHSWVEGVAASLTELFAPDLMRQRLESFPRHYSWIDSAGLEYFRDRLTQAPRDSAHGLEIVRERCVTIDTQRGAFDALAFKLELLWVMIDAIDHGYREGRA